MSTTAGKMFNFLFVVQQKFISMMRHVLYQMSTAARIA